MTSPVTPKKQPISCWEVPTFFKRDLDSFKKIAELGYAITNILGFYLSTAGSYLKPIGAQFKVVSGYFPATKLFTDIAAWVPDEKGTIRAIKTTGNQVARGISNAAFHLLDLVDTYLFLGKLKVIDVAAISQKMANNPVLNFFSKNNYTYLRSGLGLVGAAAAFTDMGFSAAKLGQKMYKNSVWLDLGSGFIGRGWFKAKEITAEVKKTILEAGKECRDISTNFLKNALKTTIVFLSIYGWALHPVVGFLSLAYTLTNIGRVILKESENRPTAYDPKYAASWKLAKELPTV